MAIKLTVPIQLKGKDETGKVFAAAKRNAKDLAGTVTALSTAYLALSQAWQQISRFAERPIQAALEAEKANTALVSSLKAVGQYTDANVDSINSFATELMNAAGMEDELIKSVVAGNVVLLKSTEQSEALTQASIGLAKARGIDLASANKMILASFSGEARELKKLVPGVAQLTAAQLKHGAAVDVVSKAYNSFITGDLNTAPGVLSRLAAAAGEVAEAFGGALLEGFDLPGNFDELAGLIDRVNDAIAKNKDQFVELGSYLMDQFKGGFTQIVQLFETLGPSIVSTTRTLLGLLKIGLIPFLEVATSIGSIIGKLKGDKTMETSFDLANERLKKSFGEGFKDVFGVDLGRQGANDIEPPNAGPRARPGVRTRKFGNKSADLDAQDQEAQLGFLKQLHEQMIALEGEQTNAVVAEHAQRMDKIFQIEQEASRKGINVSRQADVVREAMAKSFATKLEAQRVEDAKTIADAAGDTTAAIQAELVQQLVNYRKMREEQRMTDEEYYKSVLEAQRKAAEQQGQTTGSAQTDSKMAKAAALIDAAKGGINTLIGAIGQMYGVVGQVIAGIIQLLNMGAEEFTNFLREGFTKGIPQLLKNVLQSSIPILLETFPEFVAAVFGTVFSVPFWVTVLKNLWVALINMFQNFWAVLFGGKKQTNFAAGASTKQEKFLGFGADDPNAGDGQFKIKDADLRSRRKAGSFEDTFQNTVDESSKSFGDYMKEAFQHILDMLGEWFFKLGDLITTWGEKVKAWGQKIWDGLKEAIGEGWVKIKEWGYAIWQGFTEYLAKEWHKFLDAGSDIGASFKAYLDSIWSWFKDTGKWLGIGFKEKLDEIWGWFKNTGKTIGDGFKEKLDSIWSWFRDAGGQIAQGFKDAVGSLTGGGGGGGGGGIKIETDPRKWNSGGYAMQSHSNPRLAAAFAAAGALQFADGGMVPGAGFRDTIPAVLTPGEMVLNRDQVAAMKGAPAGSTNVNITFNVAAGAKLDKETIRNELMPQVIEVLKRESRNGTLVVRKSGVL